MASWRTRLPKLRLMFHLLIVLISITSIVLHIVYSPAPWVSTTKFTIHSNLIVSIAFLFSCLAILKGMNESPFIDYLKNCAIIYMTVTIITYHFILASGGEYTGVRIITNFTLHYLIPIFVYINWVVFEKKRKYNMSYIFYWMLYPLVYTIVSLVRGLFDGFYPYFFFNPNGEIPVGVGSYANVFKFVGAFLFVYIILGILLIALNRICLYYQHKKSQKQKHPITKASVL